MSTTVENKQKYQRLVKLAANASIGTATLLIVAKFIAWAITGSVSVLASLIDSIFDVSASVVNRLAIQIALKPADEDHHFGHGKAEQLASLAQAAFIAGAAFLLILHAIDDLRSEININNEKIALIILGFSIFVTLFLLKFQSYVIAKTKSTVIIADAMHYKMDLLSNTGVIIALFLSKVGYHSADAIIAIIVALFMLFNLKQIVLESIQLLMDKALPEAELKAIEQTVLKVDGVKGIHNLRTRGANLSPMIYFHLDIARDLPLKQAHDISIDAKQSIQNLYPNADIMIHLDPY